MLKEGDSVSFLHDKGNGVIIRFMNEKEALVLTQDGFENVYPLNELVYVHPQTEKLKTVSKIPIKEADHARQKKKILTRKDLEKGIEIDLHIQELLDDWRHMSNREIVEFQLRYLRQRIKHAMERKYKKLIIIHGKGEGVLREEVRSLLQGIENVSFHDASYVEYGTGATEVILWYK